MQHQNVWRCKKCPIDTEINRRERAIVFEGIDFFMVWFFAMTHNYKALAKHFVRLDDSYRTDEEVIAFLKTRLARLPDEKLV